MMRAAVSDLRDDAALSSSESKGFDDEFERTDGGFEPVENGGDGGGGVNGGASHHGGNGGPPPSEV
jgi:hypothetical protein